ncbi:MAG: class I SAM-dependent methyltransferase [Polynucleobacter sp.]
MSSNINVASNAPLTLPWHARTILSLLEKIQVGQLTLVSPEGEKFIFRGTQSGIEANIQIHDWLVCKACLKSGDIGLAETYIDGLWDSTDIQSLLRLFLVNRQVIEKAIYGSWLGRLGYRIKHWLNKNSKTGSKKNIHAHYDIGNAFYSLWLDPSMTYSSACFKNKDTSLIEAQEAKYQRIIDSINVDAGQNILEVGCGWGGLMEAASNQGINIDCLTISQEQAAYARDRAARIKSNSSGKVNILLQDYRDHQNQYDGIASIEMFEAVGEKYWATYFEMIQRCLKPGKKACIQTIVIADNLFDKYRRSSDFIQQYVFPGGMLPSIKKFKEAAQSKGLIVEDVYEFGQDYQKTLCLWHQKFNQHLQEIKQQGFDEKFIRLWNLYLMYCAAGFAEKSTDVVQFTLSKPA